VLPLSSLLLGTSVLGDELEEGTAIYLLTRPIERWQILVPKILAATLVTASLTVSSALLSSTIALGEMNVELLAGFIAGICAGALAYTSVFVLLSLVTTRALITGLVYVFIWEASITSFFDGARYLSIRHYVLGLAGWIASIPEAIYDARIEGLVALGLISATIAVAVVYANLRLQEIEVREAA
jgi:ABC-2 type transport system permease protein